jgi:hypothetical protein
MKTVKELEENESKITLLKLWNSDYKKRKEKKSN